MQFGKQVGGDIIANKKTYLLIKAMELENDADKVILNKWIKNSNNPTEKGKQITRIYNRLQLQELAIKTMRSYTEKSFGALDEVNLPIQKKDKLRQLTENLLVRNS